MLQWKQVFSAVKGLLIINNPAGFLKTVRSFCCLTVAESAITAQRWCHRRDMAGRSFNDKLSTRYFTNNWNDQTLECRYNAVCYFNPHTSLQTSQKHLFTFTDSRVNLME